MTKKRSFFPLALVFMIFLVLMVSACATRVSEHRRPMDSIQEFEPRLAANPEKITVYFDEILPGTPMEETVWDNVKGAYPDKTGSTQMGLTQKYNRTITTPLFEDAPGGPVVGLTRGQNHVQTRMMIPFGRIFKETCIAGLKQAFPDAVICADQFCIDPDPFSVPNTRTLRIKIHSFQVWESVTNHMNLRATVISELHTSGDMGQSVKTFKVNSENLNQHLGSTFRSADVMIAAMNTIVNQFSRDMAAKVLKEASGY